MATEKRMIDANKLLEKVQFRMAIDNKNAEIIAGCVDITRRLIENAPTVDAVEVPCKIGDFVWAIRSYHGKKHPQRGIVSDMYFLKDMSLQIVVKYVARGKWGENIFASDKEAYEAIERNSR